MVVLYTRRIGTNPPPVAVRPGISSEHCSLPGCGASADAGDMVTHENQRNKTWARHSVIYLIIL